MFVVHACWLGRSTSRLGGLAIWGEGLSAPTKAPRRPGRPPRIQPHPYAATHAELVAPPVTGRGESRDGTETSPFDARRGASRLRPSWLGTRSVRWRGCELAAGKSRRWNSSSIWRPTLAVLRGLDGETAASGASVVHLIELAEFAAELVARGRVLPVVLSDPLPCGMASSDHGA